MIGGIFLLVSFVLAASAVFRRSPVRRFFATRQHPGRAFGVISVLWLIVLVVLATVSSEPARQAAQRHPTPATTAAPATPAAVPTSAATSTPAPTTAGDPLQGAGQRMQVVDVVDGDTVKLAALSGGNEVTVRLLGIDTPETKDPRKGVGCYGPEASAWAAKVLTGTVLMRTDPTQDTHDKYGRTLAYLTMSNGQDYSIEAAREGYAKHYVYDAPVSEAGQIESAEDAAHRAGRGLWGTPCYGDTEAERAQPVAPTTETASPPETAYYKNCTAARDAGAAPLHTGEPGYSSKLDRDGDGIACEN